MAGIGLLTVLVARRPAGLCTGLGAAAGRLSRLGFLACPAAPAAAARRGTGTFRRLAVDSRIAVSSAMTVRCRPAVR
jgi:hypothetical protein